MINYNTRQRSFSGDNPSTARSPRMNLSMFQKSRRLVLLLAAFLFVSVSAMASHFRYGLVTATRISETSTTVTYRFNVNLAWRTGSAASSAYFTISGGNSGSFYVSMINVASSGGDWIDGTGQSADITLNKTSTPTRVTYYSCCKISTIQNNSDGNWDVYTVLNTAASGSTPLSTMPAIINMPIGSTSASFSIPASDPDAGSTLTFGYPDFTSGNLSGQSEPSGFSINSTTGVMTMNTVGKTAGDQYNAMVTVTDNQGNQIMLDFLINMVGESNPPEFDYTVTPANGTGFNLVVGETASFVIKATDPDAGSTVSLSASGLAGDITTSNFSPAFPATGNPSATTFTYTPGTANLGTTVVLNFIATDNVGVQANTSIYITVVAEPAPVFVNPTPIQASIRSILAGESISDTIVAQNSIGSNISIAYATIPSGATTSPTVPTTGANPGYTIMNYSTSGASDFGEKSVSFQAVLSSTPSIFASRNYTIVVNSLPTFTSTPITTASACGTYSYNVVATDPDIAYGDVVEIESHHTLPSWLTIVQTGNGTATLVGSPSNADTGTYHIGLVAADMFHHNYDEVEQEFEIVVTPSPLVGTISGNDGVFAGNSITLTGSTSYGDWSSSSNSIATVSSTGVVTGVSDGVATITFSNTGGCTDYDTHNVTVKECSANATLVFNYTGSAQTWTVPDGITSIDVTLTGAEGGVSYYDASRGSHAGRGGKVTATLAVTPGQVLNLYVGGKGQDFTNVSGVQAMGGYNGGGNGGAYGYYSAGGGGASDIRIGGTSLSDRVIVAGGGGANGYGYYGTQGGHGGGTTGANGEAYSSYGAATGGSQTSGGIGGTYSSSSSVYQGDAGTLGQGGEGSYYYGGGGGGGYYGGGGAGYLGSGGGGSSFANGTYASSVVHTQGYQTNNGQIIIAFEQPLIEITTQPTNTSACSGNTASFSVAATLGYSAPALTYQWQENNGSGYSNISGATSSTLSFTASAAQNGYQYRCNIAGICDQTATSDAATLTISSAPAITVCPSAVTVDVETGTCGNSSVSYSAATVTGTAPTVTYSNASGSTFSVGTTAVTVNATNSCGSASCSFNVTVNDNENPTITAPSSVSVNADAGACAATGISLGSATTADNCGIASVTNDAPSSFGVGVTTVNWTVTDVHGNTATATQTVTVADNQNPTITAPANVSVNADAGACAATGVSLGSATTADNCGVASVTNDAPSSYSVGTTTVNWTVTDVHGNTATTTQTVTVADNQNPTITAPANVSVNADAGACAATGVTLGSATTADNCGVASVTNDAPASYSVGTTTVNWTVTDVHGNTATATQTVTVSDDQNPTITAPSDVTVSANEGECAATGYTLGSATTADNCGVASVTNDDAGTYAVGTHTVNWTVTDIHGNTATTTQTITVVDTENPIARCHNHTLNLSGGSGTITASDVNDGSSDNCGIASMTVSPSSFTCADAGENTVTLTVTDIHGNVSTCTSTVTVQYQPSAVAIDVTPSSSIYTGGVATTIYLGYGAQTATLSATGTGGSGFTYSWAPGTALSCTSCANPVFAPTTPGSYTYTVTATNSNGCSTTNTITMCVINAKGTKKNKVLLCHVPPGNPSAAHTLSISASAVPAHLSLHSGDRLGACGSTCGGSSKPGQAIDAQVFDSKQFSMLVYPNPFNNEIHVDIESDNSTADVILYDVTGRTREVKIGQDISSSIIIGQDLPAGIYILEVRQKDVSKKVKITKL